MSDYSREMKEALTRVRAELRSCERFAELAGASADEPTPQHELDHDLPAYLVFLILANTKKLGEMCPDHVLVKAVRDAVVKADKAARDKDDDRQLDLFD